MNPTTHDITYSVHGMTCDHCRIAVTQAVAQVAGVETVDVDLATGRMRVVGLRLDGAAIAAAVAAAGYEATS